MKLVRGDSLLVATHNAGKLEEIAMLMEPYSINVISAASLALPEPDETESTFVGNARIKAHAGLKATGYPTLADDSGITVDALHGAPGVYTADWAETGQGRDFQLAMRRVWAELETVSAPAPRRAQFRCTLVIAWPDGSDSAYEGVLAGQVVWPMRGVQGHGYDPIFQPDGYSCTLAELPLTEKNRISHRAAAFQKLMSEVFA